MPERSLRFGISNGVGLRAATWKLWTQRATNKSDVYLACRSLGGSIKASLHESGQWHVAYSKKTFEERVQGAIPRFANRFVETWPRPPELAPGITLAYRIVTPSTAVTTPFEPANFSTVCWIPNAAQGFATEIDIFLLRPGTPVTDWPGRRSMGTSLIGSLEIENGETAWAVYRTVPQPNLVFPTQGTGYFYRGSGPSDLDCESLRAMVFGDESDGSKVIYDCTIQRRSS